MTEEERIKANAEKGYILVASFDGWDIHKKQHENGWTYYSDQIGYEGSYIIWDTAVRSTEELITLIKDIITEQTIEPESDLDKAFKEFWEALGEYLNRGKNKQKDNDNGFHYADT